MSTLKKLGSRLKSIANCSITRNFRTISNVHNSQFSTFHHVKIPQKRFTKPRGAFIILSSCHFLPVHTAHWTHSVPLVFRISSQGLQKQQRKKKLGFFGSKHGDEYNRSQSRKTCVNFNLKEFYNLLFASDFLRSLAKLMIYTLRVVQVSDTSVPIPA